MSDLFGPVYMAQAHRFQFAQEFLDYLPANVHVYEAFEREALRIAGKRTHYSARTIIEVLRHESNLRENSDKEWKLNDHHIPYWARLFALMHPAHAKLFEFRAAKKPGRDLFYSGVAA